MCDFYIRDSLGNKLGKAKSKHNIIDCPKCNHIILKLFYVVKRFNYINSTKFSINKN